MLLNENQSSLKHGPSEYSSLPAACDHQNCRHKFKSWGNHCSNLGYAVLIRLPYIECQKSLLASEEYLEVLPGATSILFTLDSLCKFSLVSLLSPMTD